MSWEFLEPPATPGRIRDRLVGGGFHALHLQAHGVVQSGKKNAGLILEDDDHQVAMIDERQVSEIFEGERDLRLIILMACHSGTPTQDDPFSGLGRALVERGIPAVVAMNQNISLQAATLFTEHFFRNLVRAGHVDTAVNEARQQLYLGDGYYLEWGTPTLFMRLRDGRLWESRAEATRRHTSVRPVIRPEIWEGLLPWIDSGDFIPFLGPGLLHGLLPSNEEIANSWAEKYGGLSEAMLVFLGYNVADLDCRALFRGLVTQLKQPQRERIAVLQIESGEHDEDRRSELQFFMTKYCENVRIHVYWGSVREFLTELYQHWATEYAEL